MELRPMKQVSEGLATALASEKALAKGWSGRREDKAWRHL